MSVVLPNVPVLLHVPPARLAVTVCPVMGLPSVSMTWTVTVAVLPEVTVPALIVAKDLARSTGPATTVSIGSGEVKAWPLTVTARLLAVPAVMALKVAVYVPLPLSCTGLMTPPAKASVTIWPGTRLLLLSSTVTVTSMLVPAVTVLALTTAVDRFRFTGPGVTCTVAGTEVSI